LLVDLTLKAVVEDTGLTTFSVAFVGECRPCTSNLMYDTVTGEPSILSVVAVPKLAAGLSD
jgi:hypothetical protein